MVGHEVDEVRSDELGQEGRQDIREENDTLGDGRADEIEGGCEDDYVEDIVDEAEKPKSDADVGIGAREDGR
jgi:hypothetical protein